MAERWWRRGTVVALAAALAALVYGLVRYLAVADRAVHFPFEIDYGEGIVWQQMRLIMAGQGYGPIDGWPAIVFHYPPVYHLLAGWTAALAGMDQLAAGRLVSIGCTLIAAGLVAVISAGLARAEAGAVARWGGGVLAALILIDIEPVRAWSLVMRVDMVFIALSLGGLWCGLRAVTRPGYAVAAGLLFVAAIYTKQSALAAPAAVFGTLLVLRPRAAVVGIGTAIVGGLVVAALVMAGTRGDFFRHLVVYNVNPVHWGQLPQILLPNLIQNLTYVAIGYLAVFRWRPTRHSLLANPADARFAMVVVYLAITMLMLLMLAKSGASFNYLIEWMCLLAMFAGVTLAEVLAAALARPGFAPDLLSVLIPAAVAVQVLATIDVVDEDFTRRVREAPAAAQVVAMIRATPRPVISDDMVALLRAGKPVLWEPTIFTDLTAEGRWDEQPLLARIRARQFGFFVTYVGSCDLASDKRYSPAVRRAVAAGYPVARRLAGYCVHMPAGAPEIAGGGVKSR